VGFASSIYTPKITRFTVGEIIGIAIGGAVAFGVLVIFVVCFIKSYQKNNNKWDF